MECVTRSGNDRPGQTRPLRDTRLPESVCRPRLGDAFVLRWEEPDWTFSNPIAKVASRLGFYDAGPDDTEQVIER